MLDLFRRINAYTAPLKEAEKRHSTYQGQFKWFIAEMADKYSPLLEEYEILTPKQISRMADSEFISELAVVIRQGIQTKRTSRIDSIYKDFDREFPNEDYYRHIIEHFFNVLYGPLSAIQGTYITKSYVIHSLFCAFTAIWYGFVNSNVVYEEGPDPRLEINFDEAIPRLIELADAHEEQDEDGDYAGYVEACLSSTTQQTQREIRTTYLIRALLG